MTKDERLMMEYGTDEADHLIPSLRARKLWEIGSEWATALSADDAAKARLTTCDPAMAIIADGPQELTCFPLDPWYASGSSQSSVFVPPLRIIIWSDADDFRQTETYVIGVWAVVISIIPFFLVEKKSAFDFRFWRRVFRASFFKILIKIAPKISFFVKISSENQNFVLGLLQARSFGMDV